MAAQALRVSVRANGLQHIVRVVEAEAMTALITIEPIEAARKLNVALVCVVGGGLGSLKVSVTRAD